MYKRCLNIHSCCVILNNFIDLFVAFIISVIVYYDSLCNTCPIDDLNPCVFFFLILFWFKETNHKQLVIIKRFFFHLTNLLLFIIVIIASVSGFLNNKIYWSTYDLVHPLQYIGIAVNLFIKMSWLDTFFMFP